MVPAARRLNGVHTAPSLESSAAQTLVRVGFCGPAHRLFFIHEAPGIPATNERGVVLCSPYGRDYVAAHRAFRVLARRLAAAGLHALRFDYFGTGDSWGETDDGSVDRWIEDILTVTGHLRALGCATVSLAGLRLGATLAALAASAGASVDRLALWEPVVDGSDYVRELHAQHREWLEGEARERRAARTLTRPDEAVGYRLTERLERDLAGVRLDRIARAPADVYILSHVDGSGHGTLARHLEALGAHVSLARLGGPKVWGAAPGMEPNLVPAHPLDEIAGWLAA